MRNAFVNNLVAWAREDKSIFLIVGDVGYSVVEPFAKAFPDRYLNAGVAEQNMIGVAAGLTATGYRVFVYSIANFSTLRCFEQIRNCICYHKLPVTVVSVGAGVAYGNLGYSHHAVQDLAVMRSLHPMTVYSPSDRNELSSCMRYLRSHPGPSYFRISKANEPLLYGEEPEINQIKPLLLLEGTGPMAIVSTGVIAERALSVARNSSDKTAVFTVPILPSCLEDFDTGPLMRFKNIVVVEEHVRHGGLYSFIRDSLPLEITVDSCSISNHSQKLVRDQQSFWDGAGLGVLDIKKAMSRYL